MTAMGNVNVAAAPSVNKTSRRRLRAAERLMRIGADDEAVRAPTAREAPGTAPADPSGLVTVPARRSRTESWRWKVEIESAGRLSLRFCRYGGNSTAAQITARMKST